MRHNAVPWAEAHAVIYYVRSVLVPGRLWFGDNAGDGCEGALLFIPCFNAFDGHIGKIGAKLRLYVPNRRFSCKEALDRLADNIGIITRVQPRLRQRAIFIPFANGRPSGAAQDVVTGFLAGDDARGRPVGLAMDGTGALLIADDAGNTVWRVAAADGSITAQPLSTDRVSASVANDTTSTRRVDEKPGEVAPVDGSATPAQSDIAPAVSSEDGQ